MVRLAKTLWNKELAKARNRNTEDFKLRGPQKRETLKCELDFLCKFTDHSNFRERAASTEAVK